jgi:hypothetical protein
LWINKAAYIYLHRVPEMPRNIGLVLALVGSGDTFPVDIDQAKTVGHLKREIKKENPANLRDIQAHALSSLTERLINDTGSLVEGLVVGHYDSRQGHAY